MVYRFLLIANIGEVLELSKSKPGSCGRPFVIRGSNYGVWYYLFRYFVLKPFLILEMLSTSPAATILTRFLSTSPMVADAIPGFIVPLCCLLLDLPAFIICYDKFEF